MRRASEALRCSFLYPTRAKMDANYSRRFFTRGRMALCRHIDTHGSRLWISGRWMGSAISRSSGNLAAHLQHSRRASIRENRSRVCALISEFQGSSERAGCRSPLQWLSCQYTRRQLISIDRQTLALIALLAARQAVWSCSRQLRMIIMWHATMP